MNTPYKHLGLLFIMILVACLTGTASDIYTPSLSIIATDLNSSIEQIQRSMAIFMLGVAISQLVYGPLSEGIGRRIPLMIGLSIFLVGTLTSTISSSASILILSRFIQGCGAGACASLWRSIFRDSFNTTEIAKYGSYVGIIMTFVVAAAPTIGGYLQDFFNWKANFYFLSFYSLCTLLLVIFALKETSVHHHKNNLNIRFFINAFKQLFSSSIFMGFSVCVFMTYGAFFSWFVVGPILLINNLEMSPIQFGWTNLMVGSISMTLGGIFNARIVAKMGSVFMLRLGWFCMISAGILLLVCSMVFGQSVWSIIVSIFIFLFGGTLIWPNSFAGAFAPFGKIAGYAGALYSFMQLGGGAGLGWLSSFLPSSSPVAMAIILITAPALAWLCFEKIVQR